MSSSAAMAEANSSYSMLTNHRSWQHISFGPVIDKVRTHQSIAILLRGVVYTLEQGSSLERTTIIKVTDYTTSVSNTHDLERSS